MKTNIKPLVVITLLTVISACAYKPSYPVYNDTMPQQKPKNPKNTNLQIHNEPYQKKLRFSAQGRYYSTFVEWKHDFIKRAIREGHHAQSLQRLMSMVQLNPSVISSDKKQAEFMKMPWAYIDSAVSHSRVQSGRNKFFANPRTFRNIQSLYGVDPEIVAAIWGMESSYGGFTGSANLADSLASLAFEGRRRDFAEGELKALVKLLERGDVRWEAMRGSWAGGMGHTQFIPGTWLKQGVDADRDGRKNPWSMIDAVNSTANYLKNSGWKQGIKPVYEVILPKNFSYNLINARQTASQWRQSNMRFVDNSHIPNNTQLQLWLPAGINGPALLTSSNFKVIKVYNNSSSYALGVSLLAQSIAGQRSLQKSWPRHEQPLSTSQVQYLQQVLTNKGYDTHGVDGVIGSNTRKAFARWQSDHGQVPDGFICQRTVSSILN